MNTPFLARLPCRAPTNFNAVVAILVGLVATGQLVLRRIDGYRGLTS